MSSDKGRQAAREFADDWDLTIEQRNDLELRIDRYALERQIEAINQYAIEASECSRNGVFSHTMLEDLWDRRLAALRAELEKLR